MPLRILQVAGGLPRWAGTEKYVLDITGALASRGHAVTLACPRDSVLAARADELGLRRIPFEMRSAYDWRQFPSFLRALAGNYDVVHTHSTLDYVLPAIAARIGRMRGVVMTRHMPHPFASPRNAYLCAPVLYDRIIAVSGFIRGVLVESGTRSELIEVVPNGIVPVNPGADAGIRLRQELGIPRDAILVAAAGRISPDKGFDVLLRAVRQCASGGADLYCGIFGSGTHLDSIRSLAADLGIKSRVRLPGFREDVYDLWRAADIAAIPSVWPEPFGYSALEALSAGCAVVASRVGGLAEVVSSESAILTEPGDAQGIAAAIGTLVSSPDLRGQMQEAARQRAKAFTLDANAAGVERVYAGVLGRKSRLAATAERLA